MSHSVIFDVGHVLIEWHPRHLYSKLLPDDAAIEAFLDEIGFKQWNWALDAGARWDESVAEAVARYPLRRELIEAAHHRWHHKHSDDELDIHSPRQRGFWWSHMFWILAKKYQATETERVKDLAQYPELRWLDRNEHDVRDLLRAYPAEEMNAYRVGPRVNSAQNDDPQLIDPIE